MNSDTGVATGKDAFGIDFEVAGATRASSRFELHGNTKYSSWAEITLADDLRIRLATRDEGSLVTFQLNGRNFGDLKRGDQVVIDEERNVTVNGVPQGKPGRSVPTTPNANTQGTVDTGDASGPPVATEVWTEAHNRWPLDIDWKKVPANQSLEVFLHEYEAPEIKGHRASPNLSDWDFEGATFGSSLGNQGYAVQLHYKGTKSGKDYYDLKITHPEGDRSGTMTRRLIYEGAGVEVFRDERCRICIQPRSAELQFGLPE